MPSKKSSSKKPAPPKAAGAKKPSASKPAPKASAAKPAPKPPAAARSTKKKTGASRPKSAKPMPAPKKAAKPEPKSTPKKAPEPPKKGTAPKAPAAKGETANVPQAKAAPEPATKKTPAPKPAPEAAPDPKASAADKPNRKGITIVNDKPARRPRVTPKAPTSPPPGPRLLGPGSPLRRPLIPSAPRPDAADDDADTPRRTKTPFNKRQLDTYRDILLKKRAELVGDVEQMETDALRSSSGGLSNLPQHIAEQGSDNYEQSLSLDLAATDRRLIKEIDDALQRIADKTYGLCELTGDPISPDRLEELPWARYSIAAARRMEQHGRPR